MGILKMSTLDKNQLNRFSFKIFLKFKIYLGLMAVTICCIVIAGTPATEWLVMNNSDCSSYVVALYI